MSDNVEQEVGQFMREFKHRNPYESEFQQAVEEMVESIMPWYLEHGDYRRASILERLTEPDRTISFRVTWEDDNGHIQTNRAWRVQFNNALGPYKGGLRFHPTVTHSVLKFLGFEQIFKNALTGLPMGGAKGGSNFDPKGKSDREVMRFCHAMMVELSRHIGEDVDVPAGDIGVGSREVSYLFGKYVQLQNRWAGVMTGKRSGYGGSAIRTEATGYGCVYFLDEMLNHHGEALDDKRVAISGSGNVAIYAAEKAIELGASVVSMSDSSGMIYIKDGLTHEQLEYVKLVKEVERGRISRVADKFETVDFHKDQNPWGIDCDIALPCATQNELTLSDAEKLVDNGVLAVCEGANMPATNEAMKYLALKKIMHAPGKASNAGGVAVSGLEQSQNSMRYSWSAEEVDGRLKQIVKDIHRRAVEHGEVDGFMNYVRGANIAGFAKVAAAVYAYGIV